MGTAFRRVIESYEEFLGEEECGEIIRGCGVGVGRWEAD
jgi:hypothetical protein